MTIAPPFSAVRDAVLQRRSIRYFRDEPIPSAIILELLRDALWAPSPHNAQPWRFTVLTSEGDRLRLARVMASRLAEELAATGVETAEIARQTDRSMHRITGAPVVIVCSLAPDGLVHYEDERRNALEWEMAVQSLGAVLQTLFLLAWTRDIGSCWMAAPMYCPDVVRACLQLPADWEPQALALLGYPEREGKIRPRRDLEGVVDLR